MFSSERKNIHEFNLSQKRYQLLRRIAAGGAGEVYHAQDRETGKQVAIKLLYPSLAKDETKIKRFQREFEALGTLEHPHVVGAFDFGLTVDKQYFLAMEFLAGGALTEYLDRYFRLNPSLVLSIGIQIAKALEFAHSRGFIHRDIKPGNILFTGKGDWVKLADFGVVKDIGGENLTRVGNIVGSYGYMPREQLMGKEIQAATDLYSLGVVMFTCLTGTLPFPRDISFFHRIVNETVNLEKLKEAGTPSSLIEVIGEMVRPNASDRIQNAEELVKKLEGIRKTPELNASEIPLVNRPKEERLTFNCPQSGPLSMSRYPITHLQYLEFVKSTKQTIPSHWEEEEQGGFWGIFKTREVSFPPSLEHHPIFNVSYLDALKFAAHVGGRLPKKREWLHSWKEDGRKFPWGDEFNPMNLNWDRGHQYPGISGTTPVNFFRKGVSPRGFFDLLGNLEEWVEKEDLFITMGCCYNVTQIGNKDFSSPNEKKNGKPKREIGFRVVWDQ